MLTFVVVHKRFDLLGILSATIVLPKNSDSQAGFAGLIPGHFGLTNIRKMGETINRGDYLARTESTRALTN